MWLSKTVAKLAVLMLIVVGSLSAASANLLPTRTMLTFAPSGPGDFAVDSFFDITYQIDFEGAPGSQLDGMSGSTIGTVNVNVGDACVVPDNGTGTADLPPDGCQYQSLDDVWRIVDGLPPDSDILIDAILKDFVNILRNSGGSLGGEIQQFEATLEMPMEGTGVLGGFNRSINLPVLVETHTGPRTPGDPVQTFETVVHSLEGTITGDPDFAVLTVIAGTGFGLPSPGETTLRLDQATYESKMHFPQNPDPNGWDVRAYEPVVVADDFQCTESGLITNVVFWGSWLDDQVGQVTDIHLSFHDDDRTGEYSKPGNLLWEWDTQVFDVQEIVPPSPQGWFDPLEGIVEQENHTRYFRYDVPIPAEIAFDQEEETIYWLDIQVTTDGAMFGVKTSLEHFEDDAVWGNGDGGWQELIDPFTGASLDLAFDIQGTTQQGDLDFGDAPEGANAIAYPSLGVMGSFPTCMSVGPPQWIQHTNFGAYFGPAVDFETDGNAGLCPNCFPPYDVDECFQDGDAGLTVPEPFTIQGGVETPCPGYQGTPLGTTCTTAAWGANIDIDLTNNMPNDTQGYVNVLIDWDQDGRWGGSSTCADGTVAPEHVLQNFVVSNPFSGPLSLLVPPSFTIGPNSKYVWARITITEKAVLLPWIGEGNFEDGETEDYLLLIDPTPPDLDFGDAPDPSYPTLLTNDGARHVIVPGYHLGNSAISLDSEPDGQPDPAALGDDNDGNDDEDGIVFITQPLIPGQNAIIDIYNSSTILNPQPGFLDGWIDFDGNGSWADAGEQIFTSYPLSVLGYNSVFVPIPAGATPNTVTYARFRFSSAGGLSYTGQASDGEVEDYVVRIGEELVIKWAQWPDLDVTGYHAHDNNPDVHIADDWQCQGGDVTDLHWWGNYESIPALNWGFRLSIYGDLNGAPDLGSSPLWTVDAPIGSGSGQVQETPYGTNSTGQPIYHYRYDLLTPFPQIPGNIYWLDIMALSQPGGGQVMWLWQGNNDPLILSQPVQWSPPQPGGYTASLTDLNMAFVITSQLEEPELDFGDAPDSVPFPRYPTLLANNGARHQIIPGFYLGNSIDADADGQPTFQANGDDNDGNDDEDGITFTTPLFPGQPACVTANLTNVASAAAALDAWIDFNGDGDWTDLGEQIFTSKPLATGINTGPSFCFPVPAGANAGHTYARFRLSRAGGLPPDGAAPDGEVEDYRTYVEAIKWEQAPVLNEGSPYPLCYWGWDEPSVYDLGIAPIVADDWPCEDDRPITDIHWWGSYAEWQDEAPPQQAPGAFHIAIWTDVPISDQNPFSHPREVVWQHVVKRNEANERFVGCDFHPDFMSTTDACFRYDLRLPPESWFFQKPNPDGTPNIYWISISAIYEGEPPGNIWGWKTRPHKFMDDAVRIFDPVAPVVGDIYKSGEPIEDNGGLTWDMAFILTSEPGPPEPPVLSIDIDAVVPANAELSWQHVLQDIYGQPLTVHTYRIHRSTSPYFTPGGANLAQTLTGPFPAGPIVWDDPGKIGDVTQNYYYVVIAVTTDSYGTVRMSLPSNRVGEFDFGLVPGS
ncbi:MAG: hypothetical protein GY759_09620 [Chloroflexi bacterium]|nr:hypothetical protein [Chloroflexota bacterium]